MYILEKQDNESFGFEIQVSYKIWSYIFIAKIHN